MFIEFGIIKSTASLSLGTKEEVSLQMTMPCHMDDNALKNTKKSLLNC